MSQTFGPEKRVRKKKEYEDMIKNARRKSGNWMTLWIQTKQSDISAKLGVIVSSKVSKLAVKRNLWKRFFRESFRKNASKIQKGAMIVARPKISINTPKQKQIEEEFVRLLKQAGIWQ